MGAMAEEYGSEPADRQRNVIHDIPVFIVFTFFAFGPRLELLSFRLPFRMLLPKARPTPPFFGNATGSIEKLLRQFSHKTCWLQL